MNLKKINESLDSIKKSLMESSFRYMLSANFFVVATNSGRVPTHLFVPVNGDNKTAQKFIYYKFSPKKYMDIAKNRHDYGDAFAKELAGLNVGLGYDKFSSQDVIDTIDNLSKTPVFKSSYKKTNMNKEQLYKYLTTDLKTPLNFYEKSFGPPSEQDDIADFKIGKSDVIIPDNVPRKRVPDIKKGLEEIYSMFKKAGIPQIMSGPIRFTKIGGRTLGYYDKANKDIKIGDKSKFDKVLIHTIIHEYAHKWYYEFIPNKISDIENKYRDLRFKSRERFDNSDAEKVWDKFTKDLLGAIKVGDVFTYEGRKRKMKGTWEIGEIKGNAIRVKRPGEKQWEFGLFPSWFMNNKVKFRDNKKAEKLSGIVMVPDEKNASDDWFPTKYSETSPSEWFADLFAFYMMGKLKGEPEKFIKEMLK